VKPETAPSRPSDREAYIYFSRRLRSMSLFVCPSVMVCLQDKDPRAAKKFPRNVISPLNWTQMSPGGVAQHESTS
jgi:hypothetical protein